MTRRAVVAAVIAGFIIGFILPVTGRESGPAVPESRAACEWGDSTACQVFENVCIRTVCP